MTMSATTRPIPSSIYADPCQSDVIASAPPCPKSRAGVYRVIMGLAALLSLAAAALAWRLVRPEREAPGRR